MRTWKKKKKNHICEEFFYLKSTAFFLWPSLRTSPQCTFHPWQCFSRVLGCPVLVSGCPDPAACTFPSQQWWMESSICVLFVCKYFKDTNKFHCLFMKHFGAVAMDRYWCRTRDLLVWTEAPVPTVSHHLQQDWNAHWRQWLERGHLTLSLETYHNAFVNGNPKCVSQRLISEAHHLLSRVGKLGERGLSSKIPIPYRFLCCSTSDFEGLMCCSNLGQLPASSQTSCFKMWKPFFNFPTTFTLAQNHSVTLNNLLLSLSRQLLLKDNLNHLMPEDGDILVISGQVNQFIGNNY